MILQMGHFEGKGLLRSLKDRASLSTYSCDLLYCREKISDTQKDWKFFEVSHLCFGFFFFNRNHFFDINII